MIFLGLCVFFCNLNKISFVEAGYTKPDVKQEKILHNIHCYRLDPQLCSLLFVLAPKHPVKIEIYAQKDHIPQPSLTKVNTMNSSRNS